MIVGSIHSTSPPAPAQWEVFGVATRGSFEGLTTDPFSADLSLFTEADSFSESSDLTHASRSVHAADYVGLEAVDVSNNVREQFAVEAWAIGQANLDPGQSVPKNVDFEFVFTWPTTTFVLT